MALPVITVGFKRWDDGLMADDARGPVRGDEASGAGDSRGASRAKDDEL